MTRFFKPACLTNKYKGLMKLQKANFPGKKLRVYQKAPLQFEADSTGATKEIHERVIYLDSREMCSSHWSQTIAREEDLDSKGGRGWQELKREFEERKGITEGLALWRYEVGGQWSFLK